jgi:surfactin synthase thioesterase subunit
VCFHHAGGGSSAFRGWGDFLAPAIEVHAVQLPGRESRLRETPHTSVATLMEPLMQALAPLMDRPVAFFGHSMGALIAFELAHALHASKRTMPSQLFVSGRPPPHRANLMTPIHGLSEAELIRAVGERYEPIPEAVLQERELLDLLIPMLRADIQLVETAENRPLPPLDIPIHAFGGKEDHLVPEPDLLTWAEYTRAGSSLTMVDGNHFYLNDERARGLVLRAIAASIFS